MCEKCPVLPITACHVALLVSLPGGRGPASDVAR